MAASNGAEAPEVDRRHEPRYPASAVPEITAVRLSSGDPLTLINVSASGMLVQGKTRLVPGKQVTIEFDGIISPKQIKVRVVRCQVSAIESGSLQYRTALVFAQRLELAVEASAQPVSIAGPAEEAPTRKEGNVAAVGTPAPGRRVFNRW
jgi:hypothetical protein